MSWQNVLISQVLRTTFLSVSRKATDPVRAAREHNSKPLWRPSVPRGWQVRSQPNGEVIEQTGTTRTLLYLHGGGYFFCSPQTHRPITFALAKLTVSRTVVPDYRLAPEHPFPAALDDAVAAYRQLLMDGVEPGSIVLGGDSAGGGLALAALVALRDAGDPLPAGAAVFSPWTDLAATGATLVTNNGRDVMFEGSKVGEAAKLYLQNTPANHPLASPLYADLAGLPPLLIQVSSTEVLLDDAVRFADKARAAGVSVQFEMWPSLPHAWQIFTPFLPEARAALAVAATFMRRVTSAAQ